MIEAFPSPEARRIEEGETAGKGEKGREGRSQREIRRAACGLLGASPSGTRTRKHRNDPVVPPASGIRGEKGMRVSAPVPIERSGGTRLLRQVCPFVYSDSDASSRSSLSPPVIAPLVPSGCDLTADARTAQYKRPGF